MRVRPAQPSDYDDIVSVVDDWWGRPQAAGLPRLFLDHFHPTSLVARTEDGRLAGFLIGIFSPASAEEAYIHFVGVAAEACSAALDWLAGVLPGEPVVLPAQSANVSLGRRAARHAIPFDFRWWSLGDLNP
jgi:hypothetical protein